MRSTFTILVVIFSLMQVFVSSILWMAGESNLQRHPYLVLLALVLFSLAAWKERTQGELRRFFKKLRFAIVVAEKINDHSERLVSSDSANSLMERWPPNTLHKKCALGWQGVFMPLMRLISNPIKYVNRLPRKVISFPLRFMIKYAPMSLAGFFLVLLIIAYQAIFRPQEIPHDIRELSIVPNFMLVFVIMAMLIMEYVRGYGFLIHYMRNQSRWNLARKAKELTLKHDRDVAENEKDAADRQRKEIENIMAMFAHKFRGPLDSVIYNSEHANNQQLYREAVRTMTGLLEIFSLISTDTSLLREKLRADTSGTGSISEVAARSLRSALTQLLSPRGSERIQQHLLAFACRDKLTTFATTPLVWQEKHQALASEICRDWEASLMELSPTASVNELSDWMSIRLFQIDFDGFEDASLRFAPYGAKASLLTILLTEAFTNMIKYCASGSEPTARASWHHGSTGWVVCITNPTSRSLRRASKGSGRGHQFLRLITEKVDGVIGTNVTDDQFAVNFELPSQLFMGSQE